MTQPITKSWGTATSDISTSLSQHAHLMCHSIFKFVLSLQGHTRLESWFSQSLPCSAWICFIFILWASILSLLNPSIAIQFKILVHFSLFLKLCLDHLQNHSASELDCSSGFISTPLLSKSHIYFLNGLDYLAMHFTNFFISGTLLLPLMIQSTHSFIYSFINSSRYLFKKFQ